MYFIEEGENTDRKEAKIFLRTIRSFHLTSGREELLERPTKLAQPSKLKRFFFWKVARIIWLPCRPEQINTDKILALDMELQLISSKWRFFGVSHFENCGKLESGWLQSLFLIWFVGTKTCGKRSQLISGKQHDSKWKDNMKDYQLHRS